MKYIGITGHRGSGKTSVAYLLGNVLEELKRNRSKDDIYTSFIVWCKIIKENCNAIYDCVHNYVYFDEFGDFPKSFVAQLLGIDISILDDDKSKDIFYVNMKTFKVSKLEEQQHVITSNEILNHNGHKWGEAYISLREFIKCFSIDIMQNFFGSNVWLKSRQANDNTWNDNDTGWRIFSDVKTLDEIKYIKDKNGILICTKNKINKKKHNGISNIEKCDVDYFIITEGNLIDLFDNIYEIAQKIITEQ